MPEPYNLSELYTKTDIVGTTQAANNLAGGFLGIGILIMTFAILLVAFKNYEGKKALAASSFITTLVAIFLRLLTMIDDTWLFGSFLIAVIFFLLLMWGE